MEVVALEGRAYHNRRSVDATARVTVPSLPGQTCIFISMPIDRPAPRRRRGPTVAGGKRSAATGQGRHDNPPRKERSDAKAGTWW